MRVPRIAAATACALLALGGCAARSSWIDPGSDLDRALLFQEQDRRGRLHGVSRADDAGRGPDGRLADVERVAQPALVDIDSVVRILVDGNRLGAGARPLRAADPGLLARKQRLTGLLEELDRAVEARRTAVDAWRKRDVAGFEEPKRLYARQRLALVAAVRRLYPRGSDGYRALGTALARDRTYGAARAWIEAEVERIEAGDRALAAEVGKKRATLRLQAFLEAGGKPPVPVHLEHYDRLERGELMRRDRWGIDLSEADRQRLKEQLEATIRLADTAERVRRGETSLRDGLREALGIASADLAQLLARAEELAGRFDEARFEESARIAKAYTDGFVAEAGAAAERVRAELAGFPKSLRDELASDSQAVVRILGVVTDARALAGRWEAPSRADLPALVDETIAFAARVRREAGELPETVRALAADAWNFTEYRAGAIAAETWNAMARTLTDSAEAEALRADLAAYHADLREAVELLDEAGGLFARAAGIGSVEPVDAAPDVPEVIDVALDRVEDTHLDLRRVPASPGDRIRITGLLERPGAEALESSASFELVRYGWYAELSPAVVLVRPDRAKGSNGFRFAPTLSWMHHYVPRPGEKLMARGLLESLQPAIGVHAAFLDFDPDTEVQVGLGATLSFWDDRLQFGAGYNLMSESDADGRYYYFIGSDLIGLLQAIGIGR